MEVVGIDFATQMPGRACKQSNIDTAQQRIHRYHQQGVTREKETRERQCSVLRETNLVGGAIEIEERSARNL